MSNNPVNLRGAQTKMAVAKATEASSPGGKKITEQEWTGIHRAVDQDISSAGRLPIGAPYPSSPLMQALADTSILMHKMLVLGSLEKTKESIVDVLKGIGPNTAKEVTDLGTGAREVSAADANVTQILEKLDGAIDKQKAALDAFKLEVQARRGPADSRSLDEIAKDLQQVAARAARTFKLGD